MPLVSVLTVCGLLLRQGCLPPLEFHRRGGDYKVVTLSWENKPSFQNQLGDSKNRADQLLPLEEDFLLNFWEAN